MLYCRDICCVSVQGLHPSKDPAYAVFEGESFGETLLTVSTVVKWQRSRLWSISWLRHQMFYPDIKISAAQARKSDDLHHLMSPFSFILSSFTGGQRILGYGRPRRKDSSGAFYKLREKKAASAFRGTFELGQPSRVVIGLQMRPLKDADPELRHSNPLRLAC